MNVPPRPPRWRIAPSPSLVAALYEDEDIDDIASLVGAAAPEWLQHLRIPRDWQPVEVPETPDQPIARLVVWSPNGNGKWDAANAISVMGYTGWPTFYDVLRNADDTLRGLDASDITLRVLPVPPIQWTAAVRSSGVAQIDDRNVWVQQTNYVAGSEQAHASRLIVHSLYVDSASRDRLAQDIAQLSDDVYQGFIDAIIKGHGAR